MKVSFSALWLEYLLHAGLFGRFYWRSCSIKDRNYHNALPYGRTFSDCTIPDTSYPHKKTLHKVEIPTEVGIVEHKTQVSLD